MRLKALMACVLLVSTACGLVGPSATNRVVTPTGDWPPFAVAAGSPPPGIHLQIEGSIASVSNYGPTVVWVAPPTVEIWEGPDRWIEGEVPAGSRRLDPGSHLDRPLGSATIQRRIGVRLWPTEDTRESETNAPWFLWMDVSASTP